MANLFDTGGGLPQTVTPFAMDLSAPIMAITQRMVQTRRQEIADDRSEIAKNEKVLLDALDFEPIQGLSDQIQTEHIQAVEDLTNKWAGEMAQVQGKLSPAKLLDLKRDQRKMEMDISNKKSDVVALAKLKEEMAKEGGKIKDSYMDVNATAARVNDYIKAGKVGSGGASFLMVPRTYSGAEIYQARYGDQLEKLATMKDERITDANGNVIGTTESTPEDIRAKAYAMADNDTTMTEVQKQQSKDYVEARLKSVLKEKYYQPRAVKASSGNAEIKAQGGNDMLDQAWKQSGNAEDLLVKSGAFQSAKWRFDKNEGWTLDAVKFDGTKASFPKKLGEKGWKTALNDWLPTSAKIKSADLIQTNLNTPRENEPTKTESLLGFERNVDNFNGTITDKTEGEVPVSDLIVRQINNFFPQGWKASKSGWVTGEGKRGSINIVDPEGGNHNFNLKNADERKALVEFYEDNSEEGQALKELKGEPKQNENSDVTQEEYAKLKTGDKYYYKGTEYTKE